MQAHRLVSSGLFLLISLLLHNEDLKKTLTNAQLAVQYQPNGFDLYTAQPVAGLQNLKQLIQQQQQQQRELPQVVVASAAAAAATAPRRTAKQIQGFGRLASETQQDAVCLTPGCVKAAAEILKNLDEKVNPCDDFYRYSCGNWIDSQVIPEDKTSVSLLSSSARVSAASSSSRSSMSFSVP